MFQSYSLPSCELFKQKTVYSSDILYVQYDNQQILLKLFPSSSLLSFIWTKYKQFLLSKKFFLNFSFIGTLYLGLKAR